MDWATVVPAAITGVVGVAGVTGTVIAARIAGKSAVQSVRISASAEGDRARLADKRHTYARALAAMDAAAGASAYEHGSRNQSSGNPNADVARESYEALLRAADAVSELQFIAPPPLVDVASQAMTGLLAYRRGPVTASDCPLAKDWSKARRSLYEGLRADLDKEAQRAVL